MWLLGGPLALLCAGGWRDELRVTGWARDSILIAVADRLEQAAHALHVDAARRHLRSARAALHRNDDVPWPTSPSRDAGSPTRVLIIGASSMAFGLGPELERAIAARPGVTVERFAQAATSLSTPEVYDWPTQLKRLLLRSRPDVVIAGFGGTDATDVDVPLAPGSDEVRRLAWGTPAWDALYRDRASAIVRIAAHMRARTVFLGLPRVRDPVEDARNQHLDALLREAVRTAGGSFVPQRDLAATPSGAFREQVLVDGQPRRMRMPDGIHFTSWGGRVLAEALVPRIASEFPLGPP